LSDTARRQGEPSPFRQCGVAAEKVFRRVLVESITVLSKRRSSRDDPLPQPGLVVHVRARYEIIWGVITAVVKSIDRFLQFPAQNSWLSFKKNFANWYVYDISITAIF
jgi:hypothetical protein